MATLRPCRCGADPVRASRKTRKGVRWLVRCPQCGRKTALHRPYGGDIAEWNSGN